MAGFIDEEKIEALIKETQQPSTSQVQQALERAKLLRGLSTHDAAVLLNSSKQEHVQELFSTANYIKNEIYGNRLVIFAPMYISSYCSNNCLYCGFRKDNNDFVRKKLSPKEVERETVALLEQGHKRVLMLMGEHDKRCSLDEFYEAMDVVYNTKDGKGSSIRRINLEIAPLTDEEFQVLKNKPIGTYTVFQETYHSPTYREMHPSGRKRDYLWRLETMDRALRNGLHDVGIGALFGLYDYRFETLALLEHANHLDSVFGVGPHTISVPRIEKASNAPATTNIPREVSDRDFKKLVSVLRCAVPYTGIILSTRESSHMRHQLFDLGVSQISAGSRTNPGAYDAFKKNELDEAQFSLQDERSTDEVIQSVIKQGYIPSFCTGCYRLGRVGKDFMDMAKPGLIKLHCQPNALTTLKEYLEDYADPTTKQLGEELIEKELDDIPSKMRKEKTKEYIQRIKDGERDLYF